VKLGWTWGELARAAGGRLTRGAASDPLDELTTDTRRLTPGQAFWCLKGTRFDAHDLLDAGLAEKCSGFIVEQGRLDGRGLAPKHVIEVTSTLKALQALAAAHRRRFDIPVAGITGSNGKTTTKEMLKGICSRLGPVCASPGNWNNQIGVPLSVLELTAEHRYGVFELADSHPGDIAEVAKVAQPTLAVLTNLGPDHLEFYGSMEANFKTKSELIETLSAEGRAAINVDDPWLAGLEPRLGPRAVTYGMSPRARVSFETPDEMIIDRHRVKVALKAFGKLSRYNAAAAAAAALAMGIDVDTIRKGLEDFVPSAMRLELVRHPSGCEIVLDAYNANPASMRAALEGFCQEYANRNKIVALGDMKELGETSERYHRELGAWLATLPLKGVYLAGPEMKPAADALAAARPAFAHRYAASPEDWAPALRAEMRAGNALFLKASRAMRFETLLENASCSTT